MQKVIQSAITRSALILNQARHAAPIDSEHAKYHDAAWDFVKRNFLLAERELDWQALMQAYAATGGTPPQLAERLRLFIELQLLSRFAYWHRTLDHMVFEGHSTRLDARIEVPALRSPPPMAAPRCSAFPFQLRYKD